jgi:hypothetical protein
MAKRVDELPPGLRFTQAGAFDDDPATFDFVRGYLYDATTVFIFGPSQSGKTFFALHLLCSTALGRPIFGMATDKRRGLYVGLEGDAGQKGRIAAWMAQNHAEENPIFYARGPFNLADETGRYVDHLIAFMKEHGIQFVVIDTFAVATAGLDEVSGAHMTFALNQLHRIKVETGACVCAIHHTGKDQGKGMRGHSSLFANSDTVIELQVHAKDAATAAETHITAETPRSAIVRKQRDGRTGQRLHFGLIERETPFRNARGETVTSLAVNENESFADHGAEYGEAPSRRLSNSEREAADILKCLNAKLGRAGPAGVEQLRRALKQEDWGPEHPDSWRSAWRNLKKKMELDGHDGVIRIA